jgi:hypothetical protein
MNSNLDCLQRDWDRLTRRARQGDRVAMAQLEGELGRQLPYVLRRQARHGGPAGRLPAPLFAAAQRQAGGTPRGPSNGAFFGRLGQLAGGWLVRSFHRQWVRAQGRVDTVRG